jgi:formiminotetrahydrofolate cyclodeaminase
MVDKPCKVFITELASKTPVPGGGGAAAMGGAIGMALSNMVGNLTIGKRKYIKFEEEVKDLISKGELILVQL